MGRGENDHILFEDESMIRDYQAIKRVWFPKGQQKIISIYGKRRGLKNRKMANSNGRVGTLDGYRPFWTHGRRMRNHDRNILSPEKHMGVALLEGRF